MSFWFFISYTRADRDSYMDKFYADLRREVLLRRDIPEMELSFFDTSAIPTGAAWQQSLGAALRTSRIMLSMCSPGYVGSEYCGKEFQVFRERQALYRRALDAEALPRVILPVLWGPPSDYFPEVLRGIQYADDDFPKVYAKEGLRYMMKLSHHKDDYEEFITRLATKVIDAGEGYHMPELETLRPFEEIPSAFAPPTVGPAESQCKSAITGFNSALFVYVAARPGELGGIKRTVECYGERGGRQWAPYLPPTQDAVGIIAQEVAARQKLFYEELPLDDRLLERLEQAEANQAIVVLVVDAWTLRLAKYQNDVRPYDKVNFRNCAMLVTWNANDPETMDARAALEAALKASLPFKTEFKHPVYYRDSIRSAKELKSKLSKTLSEIRMRMIESAVPTKRAESERIAQEAAEKGIAIETQPVVSGPGRSA